MGHWVYCFQVKNARLLTDVTQMNNVSCGIDKYLKCWRYEMEIDRIEDTSVMLYKSPLLPFFCFLCNKIFIIKQLPVHATGVFYLFIFLQSVLRLSDTSSNNHYYKSKFLSKSSDCDML